MKDIATKIDNDPSSAGKLTAEEFNHIPTEIENAIKPFMNLDENDSSQLYKAIVSAGAKPIDTISDFRLMEETPEKVFVSGYYVENDGAFGSLFFKKVPNVLVDNGGTIIVTVNATYELQYNGEINVKWFGAKGDGIADDTTAIQSAINVESILFSKGVYLATTISIPNDRSIRGEKATIKSISNDSAENLLKSSSTVSENTNITIRDIIIDGDKTNSANLSLIYLKFSTKCSIVNCTLLNAYNFAINIEGGSTTDLLIDGNIIRDANGGINFSGTTGTGNRCVNNSVSFCDGSGIVVQGGSKYVLVDGNTCNENGVVNGNGIFAGNANTCIISNNTCNRNSLSAEAGSGIGINPSLIDCYNHTITGNICMENGDDGIDIAPASGIVSKSHTITGNILKLNVGAGINISGAGDASFINMSGNHIELNGLAGIHIDSASDVGQNVVNGNTILNNGRLTNSPAIRCYDPRNTIIGNVIDDERGTKLQNGIALVGAGQVCIGNMIRRYDVDALSITADNDHIIQGNYGNTIDKIGSRSAISGSTPSIKNNAWFELSQSSATNVTAFNDGMNGQKIIIYIKDANTTFVHGADLRLSGGVNWTPNEYDMITFMHNGLGFVELSRTAN